jgi:hypothetical protein
MIIYNGRNQVINCIHIHPHVYRRDRACTGTRTWARKIFNIRWKLGDFWAWQSTRANASACPKGTRAQGKRGRSPQVQCKEGDRAKCSVLLGRECSVRRAIAYTGAPTWARKIFQYKVSWAIFELGRAIARSAVSGGRSPEVQCHLSDRPKSSIRRAIAHSLSKIKTPFPVLRGRRCGFILL